MKLIRLADDRYVLSVGSRDVSPDQAHALMARWKEWWEQAEGDPHRVAILADAVYEDRREPDIESRLRAIEERLAALESPR